MALPGSRYLASILWVAEFINYTGKPVTLRNVATILLRIKIPFEPPNLKEILDALTAARESTYRWEPDARANREIYLKAAQRMNRREIKEPRNSNLKQILRQHKRHHTTPRGLVKNLGIRPEPELKRAKHIRRKPTI